MASRYAGQLKPGDRGRTPRHNLVVDDEGNKYLREWAEIELDVHNWGVGDAYVHVAVHNDDRVHVGLYLEEALELVEKPEAPDEGLVWVDELYELF